MSAEIIQLRDFRPSGVLCPHGVMFPRLYRVSGYAWKSETGEPDKHAPLLGYSLYDQDDLRFAEPQVEPITHLRSDDGWVIVRHHRGPDSLDGYFEAELDLLDLWDVYAHRSFQTDAGLFTILQRPPMPDRPGGLIVYRCGDWAEIVDASGQRLDPMIAEPIFEDERS